MAYLGSTPARAPLSSAQIEDGTIATVDIADDAVTTAKIAATDLVLTNSASITGATPTLTIGDGGAEDTKIVFDGNAQDYYIGIDDAGGDIGGDVLTMGNGSTVGSSPAISIDSDEKVTIHTGLAGRLLMGVHDGTHNAKNTRGLTVELGDADNEAVTGKSSDIAHGNTSVAETDSFFTLSKASATAGGLAINGIAEGDRTSNSLIIQGHGNGDSVNATKTANGGDGAIVIMYRGHDGSNGAEDVASDGNILSVGCAISGGGKHKFIIDEDGDIFNDGADSTAYDSYDDAALLRALELWRGEENPDTVKKQLLPSRYDDNRYSKEQLADTKLMQVVSDKDWKAGDRSLVSVTGQVRVTNGAIWQNHEMLDAIIETMEERDSGFTAALKKKFVARGLPTQILDWTGDIPDDLKKPDVAPKAFNAE